jgi:hypothetical protein
MYKQKQKLERKAYFRLVYNILDQKRKERMFESRKQKIQTVLCRSIY